MVALLAEGVDRNVTASTNTPRFPVALLAEGVDRNHSTFDLQIIIALVALLAEGVDRNLSCA